MASCQPAGDLAVAVVSSGDRPGRSGRWAGSPELLPWGKAATAGPGPDPRAGPGTLLVGSKIAPGLQVLAHRRRDKNLDTYECWNWSRNCSCLVKVLRPDRMHSAARRSLVRESRLLLSFRQPHLIRAY